LHAFGVGGEKAAVLRRNTKRCATTPDPQWHEAGSSAVATAFISEKMVNEFPNEPINKWLLVEMTEDHAEDCLISARRTPAVSSNHPPKRTKIF
jgi:hypothetical protein